MAKAKEDFVVIHGSVKTPEKNVGYGEVISLDPDEAKKMDPTGASLMPKAHWDAKQAGAKAAAKAEADVLADAEKSKGEKKDHGHGKGGGK